MLKITLTFVALSLFARQIQVESACNPPCKNNQPCALVSGAEKCVCSNDFAGTDCGLTNPCAAKPCKNGACFTVIQIVGGAEKAVPYCQCYSGWLGTDCSTPVSTNPCISNPCYNSGVCSLAANNAFMCTCVGPYTGPTCGTYVDYCANKNCLNGGICKPDYVNQVGVCSCLEDYFGDLCEQKINYCQVKQPDGSFKNPCLNGGTCMDLIGGFVCQCASGYTGETCNIPTGLCSNPNLCIPPQICTTNTTSPFGYECVCPTGYFGSKCIPDPCVSQPCKSNKCIPIEGSTVVNGCTCPGTSSYVCLCPGTNPEYAGNC